MNCESFRKQVLELVASYEDKIELLERIISGQLEVPVLRALGMRLYAEARGALQIKLPERIRICPLEAVKIRRLWWHLLEEESGNFEPGKHHAALAAEMCYSIGVSQAELNDAYAEYVPTLGGIRSEPVSIEVTMRELSQMYVDEVILCRESNRLADALHRHYGIREEPLHYFRLHAVMDVEHSNAALDVIAECADSSHLQRLVIERATECLANYPIWFGSDPTGH